MVNDKREQNWFFGFLNATADKDAIVGWKQEFNLILGIFNVRFRVGIVTVRSWRLAGRTGDQ
jgi:hypothetical protein